MTTALPLSTAQPRSAEDRANIIARLARMTNDDWDCALRAGEFVVVLQPVVRLSDMQLTGFEGLTRWQHPSWGELDPGLFLAALIHCGKAADLTRCILEQVAQFQMQTVTLKLQTVPISVNATGTEFQDGNRLVDSVQAVLARYAVPFGSLALEMTESEWVENRTCAACNIANLRELGLATYADDFGHAFASLKNLLDFDFAGLKMDRSFVLALTDDARAEALIRHAADLARDLKLSFVAEGIESEHQLTVLRRLGVSHGQGYFFSKPLPMAVAYGKLTPIGSA